MFKKVFYLRDRKTKQYWDGKCPGTFSESKEYFWISYNDVSARFSAYIQYQAALKINKFPFELEIEEFDVLLCPTVITELNKETHQRQFFTGRIKRAFGKDTWDSPYAGLLYLTGREKTAHQFAYWCKLTGTPRQLAQDSGNTAFIELVERSACVKLNQRISGNPNPWIGVCDIVDFTFLKLATPILITVITEDYLK